MINFVTFFVLIGVALGEPIPRFTRQSGFPDGRIIGGNDTSIVQVPYQVSIALDGSHFCGGSIIAKNWVLSAGHCAQHKTKRYTIRAGSDHSNFGGTLYSVSLVISHESYHIDSYGIPTNDIALFRISKSFILDKTRRPIELYEKNETTKIGAYSIITGWGTVSTTETIEPYKLQTISVPIISREECTRAYEKFVPIKLGEICAIYPQGGKDACQGDSGGPMVVGHRLAGVVSWGNGCAVVGYPGVYTSVAYYRDWIDKTMKECSSSLMNKSSLVTIVLITMIRQLM